ncbi:MAG: glycogen synthase GlgA [Halanaerobiales bacterium]
MSRKLKILFVASEVEPFVKSGGLADVAGSLPQALRQMGHDTRVVLPEYGIMDDNFKRELEHVINFNTTVVWRNEYVGVNKLDNEGVPTYFIDNKYFFNRPTMYENDDKEVQFTFFNRAVLEMLPKIDFKPDIIHFNDWQTGIMALLLKDNYKRYNFYQDIKTVYTIHNLRYQGKFSYKIIEDVLGVDHWHWYSGNIRHDGLVNFMKAGILYADKITTVSETYAEEIKNPYYGEGLDYVLRMRDEDLNGIVNGISYDKFNPETDSSIYYNYNLENLEGKKKNKLKLQQEMDLPKREGIPLVGIISRLVEQKGLDLVVAVLEEALYKEDMQFVLLGTGQRKFEEFFREMSLKYPEKVSTEIKYDAKLAQKIYAGSDMLLMPSRFEPCGLSQLISMRYGTIPIVRETGGLNDTVEPYDEFEDRGYGFSFANFNAHDMFYTMRRAFSFYRKKEVWQKLIKRAMKLDFSWNNSANKYNDLYQNLMRK